MTKQRLPLLEKHLENGDGWFVGESVSHIICLIVRKPVFRVSNQVAVKHLLVHQRCYLST